ncbi:hypothetical protein MTR62_07810 [Novosphingobium sp. 1949]|uniref:Uncharacterized protein n=1 Tax=Novosphingobium organovorum TaxID=2930092 RepID=A0ABT0BCS9_9SPHN|nr:hypothetical protein [Novosphingobium organovorum]MCJ2182596.1 hypothetical protein [Novosphingobium organovorum]
MTDATSEDRAAPALAAARTANATGGLSMDELTRLRKGAALPEMPVAPGFSASAYPPCREDFRTQPDTLQQVEAVNACTSALDAFYAGTMLGFRHAMAAHQQELSRLYTDQVGGNPVFTPQEQKGFFQAMRAEHAASNPDGDHFAAYREAESRDQSDRTYLQGEYCRLAGC